jgi:hypothetical protein
VQSASARGDQTYQKMAEESTAKKKFQYERGQYDDDHIFDEELDVCYMMRNLT